MPKLTNILKQIKKYPLNEYSDKVVKFLIDKWQKEDPKATESVITQLIKKFEQSKDGLPTKQDKVAIPERFKNNKQLYLDITQYSFEELVKLLQSLPKKDDEKSKKEMIKYFVEKERLEKPMVQSYINRFFENRRELKYKVENGDEETGLSKSEVRNLIPNEILRNDLYLEITNWRSFTKLEQMLDALFPREYTGGDEESENSATTDADKVYSKDGIEIYKGDAQHKCVSYNPQVNGKRKYGWCITQPGNSNYDGYRFQHSSGNRMFYFVFDRSRSDDDKWHAFVIHVGEDNKQYWVTDAKNSGDHNEKKWADIVKRFPPELGQKMAGLEKVFKYIPPSKAEIASAALRGKKLTARDFIELDADTKAMYVQSNAGSLSNDILQVLDNNLKNLAINYGQPFSWNQLKNIEPLAKRYAIFRFRHTNYGQSPIPLPFIKYLDDEAKQKYFETFEESYLTFEQIEKYFGDKIAKEYVENQLRKLGFLPKEAGKYIDNPKTKKLFDIYLTLFTNWEVNTSEVSEEDESKASNQSVRPLLLTKDQWAKLSPEYQNTIIELVKKFNGNEKYDAILYGAPFIINHKGTDLLVLPTNLDNDEFYITDTQGKPVMNKKVSGVELGNNEASNPYVFEKYYPSKDVKIADNKMSDIPALNEATDRVKFSLQRKAGIIR